MKRIFIALLVLLLTATFFMACNTGPNNSEELNSSNGSSVSAGGENDSSFNGGGEEVGHTYKDFTPSEKQLFIRYIGEIIPFIANDEYYVEGYYDLADYENGINFYTYGNSQTEFEAYRLAFVGYQLTDTYTDILGDLWYTYVKGNITVDLSFYVEEGKNCVDVYVCINPYGEEDSSSTDKDSSSGGSQGGSSGEDSSSGGGEDVTYPEDKAELLAIFDFGSKGSSVHSDGNAMSASKTFTSGNYSLNLKNATKVFENAFDAKGNSCLKVGSSSSVGSFDFTVASDVNCVVLSIAQYKDKDSKVLVNGSAYTITTSSNSGEYTYIGVDTSDVKQVTVVTGVNACRIMINDISYYSATPENITPGENQGGSGGEQGGSGDGEQGGESEEKHLYTDFTQEEKALFNDYFGTVIPFIANDEYYVEEYSLVDEEGINFYAFDNTEAEFEAYLLKFSSYTFDYTEVDEYGDTWYYYSTGDLFIDLSYYYYEDSYIVDVYAYYSTDSNGNQGGSGGDNYDLLSNTGKGLPTGVNGVYNVDFTKAKYVKNVTELGTYLDGCPTVSTNKNPAVLVIPVEFSDVTASSKGYSIDKIERAFNGGEGETDYYSVHDYYFISSAGKLDLDITVYNAWFRPSKTSSYYINATYDYYGEDYPIGDQLIIDEFLASVEDSMDLSVFDSDGNSVIDAIVLINTLDVNDQSDFNWAYRYWNIYTDDEGYYYEYDGVSANDYIWASYQFMHESYDANGDVYYTDSTVLNTYTYIHEFGHVLGSDDYYDYSGLSDPMGGCDMMDASLGDHSAFTKFNYGWITTSRLITCAQSVTLQLESFISSGDTIIIANDWDESLGLYQEYYIVAYYTNEGLNSGEAGFFSRDGIVVYHVNATLYKEVYDGETYYDIYNNNTHPSNANGTADNLIEFVKSANDTFTYVVGDSLSSTIATDADKKIAYTFTVDSLENGVATLTFTKNS